MKKLILLLLFFAAKNITSQNGWTTFTASVPTGTSALLENVIFIDNAGNKWVGFSGGSITALAFAKYDNASSTWTYWNKTNLGIPTSSVSNNVKAFEQDNLGNIWIGTTNGLVKYDGTNFTLYNTANGLPNNVINCLEFSNNMLYIGTGNGLSRYDGSTFTNYTIANTLFPIASILDLKAENSTTLWATNINSLVQFTINSSFTSTSYTTAVATSSLNKIYIDAAGTKWLTGYGNGVIRYNSSGFTYFNSLYPNYVGTSDFDGADIGKGPNNGILVTGTLNNTATTQRCLIEFLSGGSYNIFYAPPGMLIGTNFENDASGKLWMTGAVTSTTSVMARIHTFDAASYNTSIGYWWGPGITSDNYKYLDVNRVKAGIANRGDMWWDIGGTGNAAYWVPTTNNPAVDPSASFAGAIWIGGLDAAYQLHTAAQTYRQTGNDFWPGPLDTTNASIDTNAVMKYDHIWKIDYNDINTFITQFNLGNVPTTYTPVPDILNWPAKGTGNKSRNLAPFVDVNNNGIYDPLVGGDYPKIKGDQALYYIFNDNFAPHTETGGLPFGIEVHAMAYAYGCTKNLNGRNELAYTTFYDYKIYNRSGNNYHDVYAGLWTDVDLGNYQDDYIGSSVQDNLGFCYNADGNDANMSGPSGYGSYPCAAGTTILKGPMAPASDGIDNDNDSIIDEVGEQCLMNIFDYYNNNFGSFPPQTTNPSASSEFYNYLSGRWKDGTNFTCGGNAYGGTTSTRFVYPWNNYIGNPCASPWTETSAGNLAGDRRYIVATGPFNFQPYSSTEFEFAYVWSTDSTATSNINIASANKLITDVRKIRSFYNTVPQSCLLTLNVGIKENEWNSSFSIYPNPANSVLYITSENRMSKATIRVFDVLGKTVLVRNEESFNTTSLDISSLNSGVYFVEVSDKTSRSVQKFVKE